MCTYRYVYIFPTALVADIGSNIISNIIKNFPTGSLAGHQSRLYSKPTDGNQVFVSRIVEFNFEAF